VLTISHDAARLVRALTQDADLPDGAGMRIVIDQNHRSLSMGLARHPEPDDTIVTSNGVRVFLSESASKRLDRRDLRAELTEKRSRFFLDR
jgi:Fe-S cluster assembly iron-binding protein IscA